MYFLAIEITRRRLASIISFLASREDVSPSFMRLLISFRSSSGTTTRGLQVDQLLLQLLHGRQVARQDGAVGLAGGDLLLDPLQVQHVGREVLMKWSCGMPHLSTTILRSSRS